MRLHNFFIDQKIGEAKVVRIEDGELLHQLKNVFRLEKGAELMLLDNSGMQYRSRVELLSKKEGIFEVLEVGENKINPARGVCLCVSMIKKDNFEWILEKGTELGVSYFIPIISERSIKMNFNHERGLKIIKEASEQCGRAKLPGLYEVITLENALDDIKKNEFFAITFDKSGKKFDPKIINPKMTTVFIGPEGGWSDNEIEEFKKREIPIFSLGDATLRAETAAIVASTLILL
jgi:16S rRNA (uracil1498-N3)-methyltransferase